MTRTSQPASTSALAATSPLGPEPMTTASTVVVELTDTPLCRTGVAPAAGPVPRPSGGHAHGGVRSGDSDDRDRSALDTRRCMRSTHRLRFGRSALAEVDGQHRHAADGEEFRLPILQAPVPEVRGMQI